MSGYEDLGRESVVAKTATTHLGAAASGAADAPSPEPAAPSSAPPQKYMIEATVGAGGMGEVLLGPAR